MGANQGAPLRPINTICAVMYGGLQGGIHNNAERQLSYSCMSDRCYFASLFIYLKVNLLINLFVHGMFLYPLYVNAFNPYRNCTPPFLGTVRLLFYSKWSILLLLFIGSVHLYNIGKKNVYNIWTIQYSDIRQLEKYENHSNIFWEARLTFPKLPVT